MSVSSWLRLNYTTVEFRDYFPGGYDKYLLVNSDVVNFLLKTNGGETEGVILLLLYFGVF